MRPLANNTIGDPRDRCGRRIRAIESRWQKRGNSACSPFVENGTHLMHDRTSRKVLRERRSIRLTSVACPTQLAHIELWTESGRQGRMHRNTGVIACKTLKRGGLESDLGAVPSFIVASMLGCPGDHLDGVLRKGDPLNNMSIDD